MSVDDAKMQGEVDFNPSQDRNAASDQAQNGHVSEQPISNAPANETLIAPASRIDPKDMHSATAYTSSIWTDLMFPVKTTTLTELKLEIRPRITVTCVGTTG